MGQSLAKIQKAYDILKNYKGDNSYLIRLKNIIFAYKLRALNDFESEYVLCNYNREPKLIDKIVKVASWWGEKQKEIWGTEFVPEKLKITWFLGETDNVYHFYCIYRRSQEKAAEVFVSKKAILTDFLSDNWENKEIDFDKYNKMSGLTLKPHQERSIKFLTTRDKGIISLQMGMGKSIASIVAALENGFKKVLVICPASLKMNWKNEISRFLNDNEITIIEGSKWKESRFTIINYDILKNFYTVPKEVRKVREKEFTDDGKLKWKTTEKIVKTNKSEIVNTAMDNSQLFQSNFDLIIIDEAHRLSNKSSGMYEIVDDLIKRSNPKGIYELTGTMVTNSPINLYNILKLIGAPITKDWVEYVKRYCDGKQIFRNRKERDYYTNIFLKEKNKNTWYNLSSDEKNELNEYLDKNCQKIWLTNGSSNLEELAERIKHLYYRENASESLKNIKKEVLVKEYKLTKEEKKQYDDAWDEYISTHEEKDLDTLIQNHKLIEGSVFRQILAEFMTKRSIKLANSEIKKGNKVIIFCCFDKELYSLQEHYKDECVIYNGKMTLKKKEENLSKFKNNENIKVFIGNLQSASVGLNINEANVVIFNNISFLPAENEQAEYRILRIGQTKDCKIIYQKFKDTYMDRMFEILKIKSEIINDLVIEENNK